MRQRWQGFGIELIVLGIDEVYDQHGQICPGCIPRAFAKKVSPLGVRASMSGQPNEA
jgi:hypothetical protein